MEHWNLVGALVHRHGMLTRALLEQDSHHLSIFGQGKIVEKEEEAKNKRKKKVVQGNGPVAYSAKKRRKK